MATNLGTGYVTVKPSMSGFASSISSEFGSAGSSSATAFAAKFGTVSTLVSSVISTVCSTITSSLSSAISRVDTLNKFPTVLQNLGYSAEEAEEAVNKLSDSINGLPTTLDSIVGYVQNMLAVVGDVGTTTDFVIALNDAFVSFGATTTEVDTCMTQFTQMISTGTYDLQSWQSIMSACPGVLDAVAVAMLGADSSATTLREALNDGTISTEDFIEAMIDLDQNGTDSLTAFSDAASTASAGIATSMSLAAYQVVVQLGSIIDAINGDEGRITSFFDGVKSAIKAVGSVVTDFVTEAIDAIETFTSNLTSRLNKIEALEGTFTQVTKSVQVLKQWLGDLWDALVEVLSGLTPVQELMDALDVSSSDAAFAIADLADWFNELVKKADTLGGPLDTIRDTIIDLVQNGVDALNSGFETLGGIIEWASPIISGIAQGALEYLRQKFEDIKAKLDELMPLFEEFAGEKLESVSLAIQDVKSWIEQLDFEQIAGITTQVISIVAAFKTLETVSPALSGFASTITGFLKDNKITTLAGLVETLGTKVSAIINPFTMAAAAVALIVTAFVGFYTSSETFREAVNGIVSAAAETLLPILQDIVTFVAEIAATFAPVFQEIYNIIVAVMPLIQAVIETALTAISAIWNAVWPVLSTAVLTVFETISNVITSALTVIQGIIEVVTGLISGDWDTVWQGICDIASGVWDTITGLITWAIEDVTTIITTGLSLVASLFTVIWGAIIEFLGGVWDSICSIAEGIMEDIQAVMDDPELLLEAGEDIIQGLIDGITGIAEDVIGSVTDIASSIYDAVCGFFDMGSPSKLMADAGEDVMLGFQNGMDSESGNTTSTATSAMTSMAASVNSALNSLSTSMSSIMTTAMSTVSNLITKSTDSIKSAWSSAWSTISSSFTSVWSGINGAATSAVSTLTSTVSGIKSKVTGCFTNASSWLSSAGTNIIKGLTNSIKAGLSSVTSAIKNVCTNAISAAKKALGISSPSKVFAEVGEFTMAGMAEGITGTADAVQDALDESIGGLSVDTSITTGLAVSDVDAGAQSGPTAEEIADALLSALTESGLGVYLNGSTLVGELAPGMSRELGYLTMMGVA